MRNEQKLIDIMFDIALTVKTSPKYKFMTNKVFCKWVADQLRQNGFDTEPKGISWGILKK